jgi:hypothetical protein
VWAFVFVFLFLVSVLPLNNYFLQVFQLTLFIRRLPTAAARVQTRVWSCGILWWTEVALGQVFSENFSFPCQSTFHLLLHNHLHYHPRLTQ